MRGGKGDKCVCERERELRLWEFVYPFIYPRCLTAKSLIYSCPLRHKMSDRIAKKSLSQ